MIITRTADTVEFQLSESRRITIDIATVASAALTVERQADGRLVPTMLLMHGAWQRSERIEAGAAQLAVMHARIVELMGEIAGPAATAAPTLPVCEEDDGYSA